MFFRNREIGETWQMKQKYLNYNVLSIYTRMHSISIFTLLYFILTH